jgi:hypothetical protein
MIILEADMKVLRGALKIVGAGIGGLVGGPLGAAVGFGLGGTAGGALKKKKASAVTAAPPPQSRDDVTDRIIISRGFARQRRGALGDQLFGSGGLEPMSPPSLGSGG